MGGIIHAETKSRPGRTAWITLAIAAPVAALAWWALGEGEPAPRQAVAMSPITRASTEPTSADTSTDADEPQTPDPASATRTAAAPAATPTLPGEIAERNANVNPRELSATRLVAARAFLNEVHLQPSPQGGFVVAEVMPDSRYERLGLRPGDRIYSLDTPKMATIDDTSMVALVQQSELELDVYRNGSLLRLRYSYATDSEEKSHDLPR